MSWPPSTPSAFAFHEAPTQPGPRRSRGVTTDAPLVLVVEDDEDTRNMYTVSLEQMGYRTASESCGEAGVDAAIRLQPSAILMDVAMPGMDGIAATRILKADPRTRAALVIVVTAHGAVKFDEARDAGGDAYFCKPFNPFTLDQVLRARRAPSERQARPVSTYKHCACGRLYTLEQWLALSLCGRMHLPPRRTIELRNCACGSSLAMPIDDD